MSASPDDTGSQSLTPSMTEVLAVTIAGVVERQLTQYVSVMAQQVEAARQLAEATRDELRAEFTQRLAAIDTRIDTGQQSTESYQKSLQNALESRLAEFSAHQQSVLGEMDARLLDVSVGTSGVDANELAAVRESLDAQSAAAHARIDELTKATRRFDEQASALVQHVNDTTVALTKRMDDGNQALAAAVEERLVMVRDALETVAPEVQRQLSEQAVATAQRLDFTENKITDRMLAMEDRINEQTGTKIATLEATIGRIGSGFDDAMGALSQRLLELENKLLDANDRIEAMAQKVSTIDESAMAQMKEQLSAAVGEAMLVRIEMDRIVASTDEKIDKQSLRMAEIEGLLSDEMDVSAAVQLERLDELERAVAELDPARFGGAPKPAPSTRPVDADSSAAPVPAPATRSAAPSSSLDLGANTPSNPTLPEGSSSNSSEPSLSSF